MRKAIWLGTGIVALAIMLAAQSVYAGQTKKHSAGVTQGEGSGAAASSDAKAPKKKHGHHHKGHKAGQAGAAAGMK